MSRRRGILMITALMVAVVLLLIGMGLLGSQASRYEAALQSSRSAQARQLALAGLEDARIKLELDLNFPPPPGPGQSEFSYSEALATDPPSFQGTYSVLVDLTYGNDSTFPSRYITVTSVGTVGDPIKPTAQYKLRAEIDTWNPADVGSSRPNNTEGILKDRFFRYTHIQDEEMP